MRAVLITSSILIVLIAALRPVLRGRIDPRVQYALWLIVALRLLLPVELAPSAYSALALLERAEEPARVARSIGAVPVPVPAMSYENAFDQAMREYGQSRPDSTSFTDLEQVEARARELAEHSPTLAELFANYARPVWLVGAVLMGLWFLAVNLRLRQKLRGARRLEDADGPVFVSDVLPSPCLCGTIRPRIYVTPAALEDPDRLRHVLAHELTHCRHRDHWWALVRCLCLCVYWFDPLVWWAAALSRQDCELACDEGAIRRLGEGERIPYGRTLVDMIAAGRTPLLQTATTMTGGRRRVRERIGLIARKPKTVLAAVLALVLVLGAAVGCTFTGAPEETPAPADTLWQRLSDLPEELRATVESSPYEAGSAPMTSYLWNVPAQREDEWDTWLLNVVRWDRDGGSGLPEASGSVYERIAQDGEFYYAIQRPEHARFEMEDAESFTAAYEAARAFAEKTLLETEGLEPCVRQPADTLQARLLDAPEELENVEAHADNGALAVYYFRKPGEELSREQYLLIVNQFSEEEYEERLDGLSYSSGGIHVFARGNGQYYVLHWNTSIEYDLEDQELFTAAQRAARDYVQRTVLETEGVEQFVLHPPETAQDQLIAVVERMLAAPGIEYTLTPAGGGQVHTYSGETHPDGFGLPIHQVLLDMASFFYWETASDDAAPEGVSTLRVSASDGSASLLLREGSGLVSDENGNCWRAAGDAAVSTPFDLLRGDVFDQAELDSLRAVTVPDRGQSHEDVVREWIEGYEGAHLKCTPGSRYACTYVEGRDVEAGLPDWLEGGELESFARSHGLEASEFQKTWFGFRYSLLFVPENERARNFMMAGNTYAYEGAGEDAPEGTMVYTRLGIMQRGEGGWTCTGVGTG